MGIESVLYADELVLCGKLKDTREMVGRIAEVCRRELKVNAGKSNVMVLNGDEGLVLSLFTWDSFQACFRIQIFGMRFGRIRYRWGAM